MAAITPTLSLTLPSPGGTKVLRVFTAAIESASDTAALATWFSSLDGAAYFLTAGMDAALINASTSVSGTTATITSIEQDGTASTDWTGVAGILIAWGDTVVNT